MLADKPWLRIPVREVRVYHQADQLTSIHKGPFRDKWSICDEGFFAQTRSETEGVAPPRRGRSDAGWAEKHRHK